MKAASNKQILDNPLAMMNGEVRESLIQMVHAITTQAQDIMSQDNMKVIHRDNQYASTMASRLRDFTRMNPPMLFGSKG